jgi:hypothetical protein
LPACSRWLALRHVRGAHEASTGAYGPPASGRRAHRGRSLERGDRGAARHLPSYGEGALRRPAPEARRLPTAPDPRRVSPPDRRGSSLQKPRPDPTRPGGLTAPRARGEVSAGAGSPWVQPRTCPVEALGHSRQATLVLRQPDLARHRGARHQRVDRRSRRSATPHHQAAPPDEAAGRDDRAHHPPRRTCRLREDHPRPRVV